MIIRRGKSWTFSIELGRDENGKRVRRWSGGYATKREAAEAYNDAVSRLKRKEYVEPSHMTLAEYLVDEWLPATKAHVAESTFANYESTTRSYVIPQLGHRPLQQLATPELNRFYAELLENGRTQGDGGLSAKSVRNVHVVLRKSLEDAVDWSRLVHNPAAKAKSPRVQQRQMKTWTPYQVKVFLAAEKDSREFPIWRLAVTTGMRRSEVLGLSWDSLDLEEGRLSIRQSLVNVNNVPTLQSDTKTASSRRLVNLDDLTVSVLKKHQTSQYEERLLAGSAWNNEHNLVFVSEIGEMLKPNRITRIFKARVEDAGLPRIRLHDLRHTHASNALQAGIHVKVVSERLGHANIGVTLNTYSHTIPAMDEQAAELVASLYQ